MVKFLGHFLYTNQYKIIYKIIFQIEIKTMLQIMYQIEIKNTKFFGPIHCSCILQGKYQNITFMKF